MDKTVGRWVLLEKSHRDKHGNTYWNAVCPGCRHTIKIIPSRIRSQNTQCCRKCSKSRLVHGHSQNNSTYISWSRMLQRVRGTSTKKARSLYAGITCDLRWYSYENFLVDMGPRPKGTTLDRINPLGNYTKSNCRWATAKQQALNRRNTILLTLDGVTAPLTAWASLADIPPATARDRYIKQGIRDCRLLLAPLIRGGRGARRLTPLNDSAILSLINKYLSNNKQPLTEAPKPDKHERVVRDIVPWEKL